MIKQPPIDPQDFSEYIKSSDIFTITRGNVIKYLPNWYNHENKDDFIDNFGANLDTVLSAYKFFDRSVSIVKNFNFDNTHQDYIHCTIDIFDNEGCYIANYKLTFDYQLNLVDDTLTI